MIGLLLFVDLDLGPLAERVHALHADAVQSTRDLVRVVAELSARMHLSEDDLDRGATIDRRVLVAHQIDGHAAAIVDDRAGSIDANTNRDRGGVAGHDFVDGVVDTLVDEVMEGAESGSTDIHAGALADRLESLENLDRLRGVIFRVGEASGWFFHGCKFGHRVFLERLRRGLREDHPTGGSESANPSRNG